MSSTAVRAMEEQGLLRPGIARPQSQLMDDALTALLCCAAGYRLSDMPEDHDILAINWRRDAHGPRDARLEGQEDRAPHQGSTTRQLNQR